MTQLKRTRLERCFSNLSQNQQKPGVSRKALTTFITAGDPVPQITVPSMHKMVEAGADILELGIPFSDPEAEGPAIQASSERALQHGTSLLHVLDMVSEFRREDGTTPVILMGYLNSIERMGYDSFAERGARAGIDGLIMVNLPPEEASNLVELMQARNMNVIFLVAPTTTPDRMDIIGSQASGFIYYVSLKGTTGAGHLDTAAVANKLTELRKHTRLPIQVGFGIRDGETARKVAGVADGVVVGSALVETMGQSLANPEQIPNLLYQQVHEIRQAMDTPPE